MAATAYPHMIFATGPDVITKELLHEVLAEAYPHGTVTDAPLKSVLTIGDYAFSFWFDDEADGLAERYAGYLPEGARRRRLNACTTMIDFSGSPDPGQAHRADAERIVSELAELEGVWVFSEESKRFVAFDYGEPSLVDAGGPIDGPVVGPQIEPMSGPAIEPAIEPAIQPAIAEPPMTGTPEPTPAPEPAPPTAAPAGATSYPTASEPPHHPVPVPQVQVEPTVESGWTPPGTSSAEPERTVPLPPEAAQPRPEIPQPTPPPPEPADDPAAWADDEKTGFFKRVFKRTNP